MASAYQRQWQSAFTQVQRAGTTVRFTRTTPGAYDASTDTAAPPTKSTIAGVCIKSKSNPQRYGALGLDLVTMPTLFVVPSVFPLRAYSPEFVLPGDVVVWNGVSYTVKDCDPLALDGGVISARIVVAV